MNKKNDWKLLRLPWVQICVFFIFILHTFSLFNTKVDTTSILLLILLCLFPYLPKLKKIKWGDFEAEISSDDIKEIKKKTEKLPLIPQSSSLKNNKYTKEELDRLTLDLINTAKVDPLVALLKLRIALEDVVSKIYDLPAYKIRAGNKTSLSGKVATFFGKSKDRKVYLVPALSVIKICNRVIHGERIETKKALDVVFVGLKILSYFFGFYEGYTDTVNKIRKISDELL